MDTRKVLFIAKLALLAVLVIVLIRTAVVLRHSAKTPTPISAADPKSAAGRNLADWANSPAKDYSAIIEQNVFLGAGSSSAMHKPLSGKGTAAVVPSAEAELGLLLLGTVAGSPLVSRAIIQDTESKMPQLYRIGEIVAGARVQSIEDNAVILLHNGQSKILRLQIGRNYSQGLTEMSRSQTAHEVAEYARSDTPVAKLPSGVAGHIETMLSNTEIEPFSADGKMEGLKISGLENVPIAKDIGLRDGDIVRQVNGHQLTDKRKAYQVLKKARTQPSINIELQREGETRELSFALR